MTKRQGPSRNTDERYNFSEVVEVKQERKRSEIIRGIVLNLREDVIRKICGEYDDQLNKLLEIDEDRRRAELNLLEREKDMNMYESELKEDADMEARLPTDKTVNREVERYISVMIFGLEEQHI